MSNSRRARRAVVALMLAAPLAGCVHGKVAPPAPLSPAALGLASEAAGLDAITSEEDFLEAKFLYQALPLRSAERPRLRLKILEYLLGPLSALDPQHLRSNPGMLGSDDDFDRVMDSLREALELYSPRNLWRPGGPALSERERRLLVGSARLVVAVHSPRGNELPVATGLFVLQALEPKNAEWPARIDELLSWLETGTQLSMGTPGPRTQPSVNDVLDGVAAVWPSPPVIDHIARVAHARQERLSNILRRPLGTGSTRGMLGELLLDGDALSAMAINVSAFCMRAGQLGRAVEAAARFSDKPGDDPELRKLLAEANQPDAPPAAFLALARRFLPRGEALRGTSSDRLDPAAAAEVLNLGLDAHPGNAEMLALASRVARFAPAPFLALRYLDEALAALERADAPADKLAELTAERLELAFLRFKARIEPEAMGPALREADTLRREIARARRRFGKLAGNTEEHDLDLALARGLIDGGKLDEAQPFLARAQKAGAGVVDVVLQVANLALRRGDAAGAATALREALEARRNQAPLEETIPFVEGQARLEHALGNAYDAAGNSQDARKAWRASLRSWERLMLEQLRRKNLASSAEATFEVGRLLYLVGRREDGLRRFDEAISHDEGRDQSYIDAIAFLVERGEAAAALDIYRRALSRPNRVVSEYVKVYASLWVLDITQRSTGAPDPAAETYLKLLDGRRITLRPPRASAWYRQLVRYAVGRVDYHQLLAAADTPGKLAEIHFYEAMRRLARGSGGEAHELWNRVIDSKMVSFFEYEMASRYLRRGAPSRPEPLEEGDTI